MKIFVVFDTFVAVLKANWFCKIWCLVFFTYIHNWPLQPFSQDYWPSFSHHLCGGTYSLKSTPNDRFFEKLFMASLIYSQSFCQKSAERGNRRRNTFRISFWCLAWHSNPGFSSNKPTHYLLDHGHLLSWLTCLLLLD